MNIGLQFDGSEEKQLNAPMRIHCTTFIVNFFGEQEGILEKSRWSRLVFL